MKKQKLVLIGNGMAGVRCIEEIVNIDPHAFDITIIGSEPHPNYNRILLSTVLQGGTSPKEIIINDQKWYDDHNIQLFTGETVVEINKEKQEIKTNKGKEVCYDKLIIATGSTPFILPIQGADKEGVIGFRTIEDCQQMIAASKQFKKATVIGGGLLGLEAARGLLNLGMEVDVVHLSSSLMDRQLDQTAAKMLQAELEGQGMNFLLEKETKEICGEGRVASVRFKDGSEVESDLVVMAVGVRPNVTLAKECGIETQRAIVVNDYMETSAANIFAVGECAEHKGEVYGLVKPLFEQGKVLANFLCNRHLPGYTGSILATQLKISGVDVFSAGQFTGNDSTKIMTSYNEVNGTYRRLVFKDQKLIGAVLFGNTKDGQKLLDFIAKQKTIAESELEHLFYSRNSTHNEIETMEHSDLICNCNGVSKGVIIEAVQRKGLVTIEDVKQCTKASSSCGGCKPIVTDLLAYIHSDECDEVIKQSSMCSCTTLTEDEIVNEIQLRKLSSIEEIINELNWKHPQGCETCMPALHYYLSMIDPNYDNEQAHLIVKDRASKFKKEDTYALTPQLYGGETSAEQLRRIADAIEKYNIPKTVITNEQRIHLMGINGKVLQNVTADLALPLQANNGNAVHNVITSVGGQSCGCDQSQSLEMGIELDKQIEYLKTPSDVTIGVSACHHDGASAATKDVGAIRMKSGWEIYVGGSSGKWAKSGSLLCVADKEAETVEMMLAFIQYYRETASYRERSWQWINRVGLLHIREVLFDLELREQLLRQLVEEKVIRRNSREKSYS
ncbi:nitrite reductase large subunit NirB [Anaerobacillus sp. MEB173]|uniref:nitrite reductase large subunit NirB n=1 Tax=Anaerobacillus sp. MEB173 TaxID=3383345 RepID=UPI003F91625C